MVQLIRRFYVKMGIVTALDDDMLLVLIQNMREAFGEWRISELENAFNLGLKGALAIDMNLYNKPFNTVFLASLMKAYKVYITPAIERERSKPEVEKVPTRQEQVAIARKAIDKCFDRYKKSGDIIDAGNAVFKDLKGNFNYPDADFVEKAKLILKGRMTIDRDRSVFKKGIQEAIEAMESGKIGNTEQSKIDRITCDLKLKRFFDELIEMEMHPLDFLAND